MNQYNRIEQRISDSAKRKPDYYIPNMKYWYNTAINANNKAETQNNINYANGIIDMKTYEYILKPLQSETPHGLNIPGDFRHIDFITPIREKNIGEYLELPRNLSVVVDNPDIVLIKEQAVANEIKPLLQQLVINKLNETQVTGVPSKEIPDIQAQIKKTIENWFDDKASNAYELIKMVNRENDFENKVITLFNYWWGTEECYIYLYDTKNQIRYDVISPTDGYPVTNGLEFVNEGEAFLIIRTISIDRIKSYYGDKLTKADNELITELLNRIDSNGNIIVPASMIHNLDGRKVFIDNTEVSANTNVSFGNSRTLAENILFYKTESKRSILYRYNELGKVVREVVDNDFEFNEELGHITIESEWITEVWKQVVIGNLETGVYIKPEPVDIQIYDELGNCSLPIFGKDGIANGIFKNPVPKRIAPNNALYDIINLRIERELASYKGTIEILPKSLLLGDNGDIKGNMLFKMFDKTLIYDDTKVDFNTVAQGYRFVSDEVTFQFIVSLIKLRDSVKMEAWDMANMNDSRYGNAQTSSTVTNNNQNIYRAKLGSMLMITVFNNILLKLFQGILEYSKLVYIDGVSGSNFNDNGVVTYFNIESGELTSNKYGLHITNAIIDADKLKQYKDFAFSASQNGEFELASTAIDSDNYREIKKKLDTIIELGKQRDAQLEQTKLASAKEINDSRLELDKYKIDKQFEAIKEEQDAITAREIKLAELNAKYDNSRK